MISKEQLQDLRGGDLFGPDNEKIGSISDIYLDDQTGQPAWATVNTGMFGGDSFVPLDDATVADGGLAVPYTKDKVKDSPRIEAGQHLDAEHEVELYRYYGVAFEGDDQVGLTGDRDGVETRREGLVDTDGEVREGELDANRDEQFGRWDGGQAVAPAGLAAGTTAGLAATEGDERREGLATGYDADLDRGRTGALENEPVEGQPAGFLGNRDGLRDEDATTAVPTAGYADRERTDLAADRTADRAGLGAVDGERKSVTRHEERLNVGKERRETGAVRLKKYVVEEQETVSVPLERESIEIERREITDGQALGAFDFLDDEFEITLVEEHPVVSKEVYAVEEIGLNKKVVTENREITESLRREKIDIEGLDEGRTDRI
ncbi:conserved domain-containing protein [Kytococcus aerolatus]|uniref:Conserved domain-containing protein n=1 Tax=Kytococcus aerolatus TaxID=592308 RepID=A0A212U6D6_9MICO|nr:PRC and DUF2382 domain-containing protein [Kytococcus aerolatus]SNC73651.1 conserved domain-containing protein [Kytococcus aerolatus]